MPLSNEQMIELFYQNPIEGVDFADGLARFSNMPAIYLRILKAFAKSTPEILEALATVTPETISDYSISIHGLKGSCYGVSAMALGDEAKALELASKAADWETIERDNPKVIEHAWTLIDKYQALIDAIEHPDGNKAELATAKTRPLLDKPDRAVIEKLLNATSNYDVEAIKAVIEELDKASYSSHPKLVEELRQLVTFFKYEAIEKKARDLLA